MSTPTVDKLLQEIARTLAENGGDRLQDILVVEPPLPPLYEEIVTQLRQNFSRDQAGSEIALARKCKSFIAEHDDSEDGGSRLSFLSFLGRYFAFLRDVDVSNLVDTHNLLKALLNIERKTRLQSSCILALSSYLGLVVLPTVVKLSRLLTKLAIGLDKRPELVANLTQRLNGTETVERVTLVESSANVIREGFKKCLSERSGPSSGLDANGRPEGRRIGIYQTANLCLKLFFQCKKLRSAEQIFGNIYQQSPPLALFPAAQRVTFLYYLGRYHFANGHFFRAQLALQEAYSQCHRRCSGQKRSILIPLIASNIILGRFPSAYLWTTPECVDLRPRFWPVCQAIIAGDLASLHRSLDIHTARWFLQRRILLQLANRCEILVWRSLTRRAFLLCGTLGDVAHKKAPTLALQDVLILARSLVRPADYVDEDLRGRVQAQALEISMEVVESVFISLVDQGLLHGFISHSQRRFAITGAKSGTPASVGFPKVWTTVKGPEDAEVPGWKKFEKSAGMVVNLGPQPVMTG